MTTLVNTGQLDVRAVWQINGVDTLFCIAKVDVLAIGASGVLNLSGPGWSFSGSVLKAEIQGQTVAVTAYSGKLGQIASVLFDLTPGSLDKTYYLSGEIHKIDPTKPDYIGKLVRTLPLCNWRIGSAGYCKLYLYGAA